MPEIQAKEKLQNSLLSVGDYLDLGWSEFSKNIKTFVTFVLLINLPIILIQLFAPISIDRETGAVEGNIGLTFILFLIVIILAILGALAIPKVVERSIIYDQRLDAITAIKNSISKIITMLVVMVILSIVIGFGVLLFLIPGIWLAIRYSFTFQAIALRDCGLNAMDYSQSIVKGRWWALLGRFLLLGIFAFILYLPLIFITGLITSFASLLGLDMIAQVIFALIFALIGYYFFTANTLIFLNFDYTRNQKQLS